MANALDSGHDEPLGFEPLAGRQESITSIEEKQAKSMDAVAVMFTAQGSTWTR
jgi:hypothetical protein